MKNPLRDKLIEKNYIELIEIIKMSERNRDIIRKFVSGETYSNIAKEYGITPGRIRTIVVEYSRYCNQYNKYNSH